MQSMTPAGGGRFPLPQSTKILKHKMANEHADAPKQFGIHFSDQAAQANKQLLAKIGSESISKASSIKGSIYFYADILGNDNLVSEELIHDPSALDAAVATLGIEIRHQNKHHRWEARLPHALKILEFAAMYLRRRNAASPGSFGVNAELKWQDDKDLETIVHLTQSKANSDWYVAHYV